MLPVAVRARKRSNDESVALNRAAQRFGVTAAVHVIESDAAVAYLRDERAAITVHVELAGADARASRARFRAEP